MSDEIKKVIVRRPKYKLTDVTITEDGVTLHQIEATKNFGDVKIGDIGGYIEKESNLSHSMPCWVYDTSKVYGDAVVKGNAKVMENSTVCDKVLVSSKGIVKGGSVVKGTRAVTRDTVVG